MSPTSGAIKNGITRSSTAPRAAMSQLEAARGMARAWSTSIEEKKRRQFASAFIRIALAQYEKEFSRRSGVNVDVAPFGLAENIEIDRQMVRQAQTIGQEAIELSMAQACYQICTTYAALVPQKTRSALGMYYTPPVLTHELISMATEAGVDWQKASVLDPACGGGAFLLPVVLRMREDLAGSSAEDTLASIISRIRGFEIDPFAAELAQVWLAFALSDITSATGKALPQLVQVCDTLDQESDGTLFDLVIGNPPYGRTTLAPKQRKRFGRSLYGHANLYGVFTDIALRWTKSGGVIAYVTPTSFLAGEYFKALRALIARECPPLAVNFINARRGVFDDVLQETLFIGPSVATASTNTRSGCWGPRSTSIVSGRFLAASITSPIAAYFDRSGSPFKRTVDALAWGSYAWFVSEPGGLIELAQERRSLRSS